MFVEQSWVVDYFALIALIALIADERDVYIAERLFSSSLVAVVSGASPRTLRIEHFKKVLHTFGFVS